MTDPELWVNGVQVASYVSAPALDIRLGPRPFLHPVRTLGGVTVTDALCFDHPWHLGASMAVPYVNGANLWGGRSCRPGTGYTWRDDHGRIAHDGWLAAGDGFAERLRWEDGAGNLLLHEVRRVTARPARPGWRLDLDVELRVPPGAQVVLGSPATSGHPGAAGYGGFFWRATPGPAEAFVAGPGEALGSADPWLALVVAQAYTLVFDGLEGDDRWFVRTAGYAGGGLALAYERPLVLAGGAVLSRRIGVQVVDGVLTRSQINAARREQPGS